MSYLGAKVRHTPKPLTAARNFGVSRPQAATAHAGLSAHSRDAWFQCTALSRDQMKHPAMCTSAGLMAIIAGAPCHGPQLPSRPLLPIFRRTLSSQIKPELDYRRQQTDIANQYMEKPCSVVQRLGLYIPAAVRSRVPICMMSAGRRQPQDWPCRAPYAHWFEFYASATSATVMGCIACDFARNKVCRHPDCAHHLEAACFIPPHYH